MSIDKSKSENKIVINQYRSLMRIVNSDINLNEKKMIRSAFNLAIKAHSTSRRKSGELFITHPISKCAREHIVKLRFDILKIR